MTAKPAPRPLDAHTDLLTYVLQDDIHNRLTPRIIDIAHTAFILAKRPNSEDGGASDWFNDTRPSVVHAIDKLRKDLFEDRQKKEKENPWMLAIDHALTAFHLTAQDYASPKESVDALLKLNAQIATDPPLQDPNAAPAGPESDPGEDAIDYKALYEQMCERCDFLDKELAKHEASKPPTNERQSC